MASSHMQRLNYQFERLVYLAEEFEMNLLWLHELNSFHLFTADDKHWRWGYTDTFATVIDKYQAVSPIFTCIEDTILTYGDSVTQPYAC